MTCSWNNQQAHHECLCGSQLRQVRGCWFHKIQTKVDWIIRRHCTYGEPSQQTVTHSPLPHLCIPACLSMSLNRERRASYYEQGLTNTGYLTQCLTWSTPPPVVDSSSSLDTKMCLPSGCSRNDSDSLPTFFSGTGQCAPCLCLLCSFGRRSIVLQFYRFYVLPTSRTVNICLWYRFNSTCQTLLERQLTASGEYICQCGLHRHPSGFNWIDFLFIGHRLNHTS